MRGATIICGLILLAAMAVTVAASLSSGAAARAQAVRIEKN